MTGLIFVRARVSAAVALAFGAFGLGTAHAQDWIEPRSNDAGRFIETALYPDSDQIGPLTSITGKLEQFMQGALIGPYGPFPPSPTDAQDLFAIWIDDPAAFTARAFPIAGSTLNPQLYLFDSAGRGALSNDMFSTADAAPRLSAVADDGTYILTQPGLYFIGIAGSGGIPFSGAGLPIFRFESPIELSGPDGPGGAGPLAEWDGPLSYGDYRIELTGTRFVPGPSTGAGLVFAAGLLLRRRR